MSLDKNYYHVQLKYTEPQKTSIGTTYGFDKTEQEFDLTTEEAIDFGKQYTSGCVLFNGKWIESSCIKEIEIRRTEEKSHVIGFYRASIFQDQKFEVVTRRFIKSQPRKEGTAQPISQTTKKGTTIQSKDVFIVHGTNHSPMNELKTMLFEFGLNPIVLHEKASGGSQTLIEKLEKYSNVNYAFVILTPDDIGGSAAGLEQALA